MTEFDVICINDEYNAVSFKQFDSGELKPNNHLILTLKP